MADPTISVPIWYDLLTKFGPPILTAFLALIAAWVGLGIANRGRKYEILLKDNYNSYGEIASFTYYAVEILESQIKYNLSDYTSDEITQYKKVYFDSLINHIADVIDKTPDGRYLIYLSADLRDRYISIKPQLSQYIDEISNMENEGEYISDPRRKEVSMKIKRKLENIIAQLQTDIENAYKQLKLPKH